MTMTGVVKLECFVCEVMPASPWGCAAINPHILVILNIYCPIRHIVHILWPAQLLNIHTQTHTSHYTIIHTHTYHMLYNDTHTCKVRII